MCQIPLTSCHSYQAAMGRLKNTLSTGRESLDPLQIQITTGSEDIFWVLMRPKDLYVLGFSPDGATFYYLKEKEVPAGECVLPFGGSHAQLGTGGESFSRDSVNRMSVLASYEQKKGLEEQVRQSMSHVVVAICEASRFHSVFEAVAQALRPNGSISSSQLKEWAASGGKFKNWSKTSGMEGTYPDVRIHWRKR